MYLSTSTREKGRSSTRPMSLGTLKDRFPGVPLKIMDLGRKERNKKCSTWGDNHPCEGRVSHGSPSTNPRIPRTYTSVFQVYTRPSLAPCVLSPVSVLVDVRPPSTEFGRGVVQDRTLWFLNLIGFKPGSEDPTILPDKQYHPPILHKILESNSLLKIYKFTCQSRRRTHTLDPV